MEKFMFESKIEQKEKLGNVQLILIILNFKTVSP